MVIHAAVLCDYAGKLRIPSPKIILDVTPEAKPSTSDLAEVLRDIQPTKETKIISLPWRPLVEEQLRYTNSRQRRSTPELDPLSCSVGAAVFEYTFNRDARYGGVPISDEMMLLRHVGDRLVNGGLVLVWNGQFKGNTQFEGKEQRSQRMRQYQRIEWILARLCKSPITMHPEAQAAERPAERRPEEYGYLLGRNRISPLIQEMVPAQELTNNLLGVESLLNLR